MPTVPSGRRRSDPRVNLSSNELISRRLDAIHQDLAGGLPRELFSRYPPVGEYVAEVARYAGVAPDALVLTPGSDVALRLICAAYARTRRAEGTVILQEPNYIAWQQTADLHRLTVQPVTAPRADPLVQGEEMLRIARTARPAVLAVSVPNGLSGGALPGDILDALAEVADRRGHLLVIDACYQAFNGRLTTQLERHGGPVVVVQSWSKSHGLAGARVALTAADPDRLAQLEAGPAEQAVSGPTLAALRNAIRHHAELARIWTEIVRERSRCRQWLAELGLRPLPSGANFVTTPVGSNDDAGRLVAALSDAGYRIRDLSRLPGLAGCVRFTVADGPPADAFRAAFVEALRELIDARPVTPAPTAAGAGNRTA
jgi:histidinol-phosphate aminotransferase